MSKDLVKVKVTALIGPNTVVGKGPKGDVRARVPANRVRPKAGDEIELPASEVVKASREDVDRAKAVIEQAAAQAKADEARAEQVAEELKSGRPPKVSS